MAEVRQIFEPLVPAWRWVTPDTIHLTLQFLGNVPDASVPSLCQAMTHAAQDRAVFPLRARSLGCFPQPARARVLWVGLDDPRQALGRLHARLLAALVPLGLPPEEHPFHPHLTLARARNGARDGQLWSLLHKYHDRDFGEWWVTHVHLVQSELQRGGAHHTILRSVPLQS
jgi:2'-5' RNA ligase